MTNEIIFSEKEDSFLRALEGSLKKVFSEGEKIAVKLHMGEENNNSHLQPDFVGKVVAMLKRQGVKPFLFDSPVSYEGRRKTAEGYLALAAEKGFSEQNIGCPVVVSEESVSLKGEKMKYGVCKPLVEADGVLLLTHVKGHFCCGFGGSIKQLGMGAMDVKTKQAIHNGGRPVYVGGCVMCGDCAKSCPLSNIRYNKGRPHFDDNWCCGCSNCVYACKQGSLKTQVDLFDVLLADGAAVALKSFKNAFFVNVLKNITKTCDCMPQSEKVISDIGFLMGRDIVAVDKASLDLINQKAGRDIFEEINKKSPIKHIRRAANFGAGSLEYSCVKLP